MLGDPDLAITWLLAGGSLLGLVALLVSARRDPVQRRLGELSAGGVRRQPRGGAGMVAAENPVDQLARRRIRQEEHKKNLRDRLMQAGLYGQTAVGLFLALRIILALGPAVLGFVAAQMGRLSLTLGLLYGLIAGIVGTLAPGMWLDHVKRARQTKIRRALPDALDVMVVCLQGGLSLPGSLARVARELAVAHPMLAVELSIVERQIQMGRSTGEAIRELSKRFDLEELRSMASVIIQAERIGSSVVTALEVFAETLRLRRHQRAEEMAYKATVKMLFPTLFFIFPAIFIVVLGPAVIQIWKVLLPLFRA